MALTHEDIHALVKEPSSRVRAEIAQKVASDYNDTTKFTPKANKIAVDIFRLLLQDTARQVRKALAAELKTNPDAPHDVIIALAKDDHDVAKEILETSDALQESDLLELIHITSDVRKLASIASRKKVTERISSELLKTKHQHVVSSLLLNQGSEINEESLHDVMEHFQHDHHILESLVYRGELSYAFAEKLYFLVSDRLKKQMTKRYFLSRAVAEKAASDVRENAILKFLSPWMTDSDMLALVDQMYAKGRLTNSMMLRALCLGEITFFEASLAKRIGIPLSNTRKLLRDPGDAGYNSVYRASKLPQEYSEAVRIFLKLAREELKRSSHCLNDFNKRIAKQIKENNYDSSVDNMDTLVTFIEHPAEKYAAQLFH